MTTGTLLAFVPVDAIQYCSPDPALVLSFACRGQTGKVAVHYGVTADPVGVGFDLAAAGFDEPRFRGFPVIRAELSFGDKGYRAVFGWLQLIRHGHADEAVPEVDLPPILAECGSPLAVFGYLPTMFDAPANPDHPDGDWVAETFLVAVPDIARTRCQTALTGFGWGYRLASGRPVPLPVSGISPDRWQANQPVLGAKFPDWSFLDSTW